MKKIISFLVIGFAIFSSLLSYTVVPTFAESFNGDVCNDITDEELKKAAGCDNNGEVVGDRVSNILNTAAGVVGVVSVLFLVISGILLTTAAGDPSKIARAKKGVLYAIIGLVVSILAWAIVNFVLAGLSGS